MTDSVALRAIYAIRQRLENIGGGAPYNTEAGQNVFISRATVDKTLLPCVIIVPGDETAAPTSGDGVPYGASQAMKIVFEIAVEGHIAAEQSNSGEQLEQLKADIKRALLKYDQPQLVYPFNGNIGPIGYIGSSPLPRGDGNATESVQCRFQVVYTEKFGDPNATK